MQAARLTAKARPMTAPMTRAVGRRRASVVALSHRRSEGEAQQQEGNVQPAALNAIGMYEPEDIWWYSNRDRALLRALATR